MTPDRQSRQERVDHGADPIISSLLALVLAAGPAAATGPVRRGPGRVPPALPSRLRAPRAPAPLAPAAPIPGLVGETRRRRAPVRNDPGPSPLSAASDRPTSALPRRRPHVPSADESARMREEYLRIARDGEEIFDAPTRVMRMVNAGLAEAFKVADVEDMMIDLANGIPGEVPSDLQGDVVEGLSARRREAWTRWRAATDAVESSPLPRARDRVIRKLEAMDRAGVLAPPGFERPGADMPKAREAYARLLQVARGEGPLPARRVVKAALKAMGREWGAAAAPARRLLESSAEELARDADAALASVAPVGPQEAKRIYTQSLSAAKSALDPENVRHSVARLAGMQARTVVPSPNLGRQLRPTCTLHMLRGMLAALGVRKSLSTLAWEARKVLGDPFAGSTTAFDEPMQRRLFAHYGVIREVPRGELFRTLLRERRGMKIRIEIGDPVYQHSLVLEGLYVLDGKTYVAVRDSTSPFPTRMEVSDFARVLTNDPGVYFVSLDETAAPGR